MTTAVVLDASVAVQLAASRRGFAGLGENDLVSPSLLWSETVSALREAVWRGAASQELADAALSAFLAAPIELRSPDGLYHRAWMLAAQLGWAKTYDAEYVALAQILAIPLLTLDARLRRRVDGVVETIAPIDL